MAKKKKDDEDETQTESSGGSIAVNDAWTGMLAFSLLALVIGTGFLGYDWYLYNNDDKPLPTPPKLTGTPPAAVKGIPKVEEQPKKDEVKDGEKKAP